MIHLSSAAEKEIARLLTKQDNPKNLFRLGVKKGGCCQFSYAMEFDKEVRPSDKVFEFDTVRVVVDGDHLNYFDDLTLDYSEDLMGGGFRFKNNLATTTCSCGNSFAIES
ncbi:MAG: iron-sulfur cluster assembly accessory protein [Cyanobacteriota bacterium]|nr:iron-sulfur cluster assembly accessory protein [Cyanobacteriota bacterium]